VTPFFNLTPSLSMPYFYHAHNCGFAGGPQVERVVELAVANYWLNKVGNAVEIGAVTPYYWPGRVRMVIDPADEHRLVTHRQSMFEFDFTQTDVLSISTIEHIGTGEYGVTEPGVSSVNALAKLLEEGRRMLVTFGAGQYPELDEAVYFGIADQLCNVYYMVRDPGSEIWIPATKETAWREYGPWANSVAILEKGDLFK
jgi:hypothetical protein